MTIQTLLFLCVYDYTNNCLSKMIEMLIFQEMKWIYLVLNLLVSALDEKKSQRKGTVVENVIMAWHFLSMRLGN